MAKIKMKKMSPTLAEVFESFESHCKAKGSSDKTLQTYHYHFVSIGRFLDTSMEIDLLAKSHLEAMVAAMRDSGLSSNSINSYTRTLKSFLSWCNEEGTTQANIKLYKAEETVKDTYTDAELKRLLKRPKMRSCTFAEYRNWVIINLLLNSGCRAATIRNIQIRDVNLSNNTITYRHTKNKNIQIVPLCSEMVSILREYLRMRDGKQKESRQARQPANHHSLTYRDSQSDKQLNRPN